MERGSMADARRTALIDRLRLLGQISSTETAMFQQAAAAKYGLGVSEMKALDVLTRLGPQTAGQLSVALRITSGAITGVIDRLERRGIVHRIADPHDRRRVVVEADLAALGAGPNVYEGIGGAFDDLHGSYSTAQLEFLVDYLERSVALTREAAAQLDG
jgi:DNA-binding MarR family transcriptional regulator